MTTQQAVCQRIQELAKQKGLSVNRLAERAGIHHSTLDAMLRDASAIRNTGVTTLKKICQGLGVPFADFWASPLFQNLDYEE